MNVKEYIYLPANHRKPAILHVTSSAQIGGTERMLLRFLEASDRNRLHHSVATMEPAGPFIDALKSIDIEVNALESQNPFHPASRGMLRAILKNRKPDLLHAYGLRADILSRGIAQAAKIHAYVSAIRSPDPWRRFHHVWLDRWTARWGRRVNLFISNSEAGRLSRIRREHFDPAKIITIHNGIQIPSATPLSESEIQSLRSRYAIAPQDAPLLILVSNLRPMKGHLDLIAALPSLIERHQQLRVLFVGRDDSNGMIEQAAGDARVGNRITFCGFVDDPLPLLRMADICCMPSHWEGCPTALLEAMALRKPIVATGVGGIPELVRDTQEALLVPPASPRALANAIDYLITHPRNADALAQAARMRAESEFSLQKMVGNIETAYARLLH